MKVSERLDIIRKIADELDERYSFGEISHFLSAFNVEKIDGTFSNNVNYAKARFRYVSEQTIVRILDDLKMDSIRELNALNDPPKHWLDTKKFKLFISHVSDHKDKSMRLRECLSHFSISGFVAHEDIVPTLAWQEEVERALFSMDAMVAVITDGFSDSCWTQQEIGVAIGRQVKVISFKMDLEDPVGFIARHQALARGKRSAEQIAKEIDGLLTADSITAPRLSEAKEAEKVVQELDDEIPF